ncbi:Uncharacterised protein [Burkholderia pseudomallei]|nr:Uncharacterised protein [Burkholderia pseudomallei]
MPRSAPGVAQSSTSPVYDCMNVAAAFSASAHAANPTTSRTRGARANSPSAASSVSHAESDSRPSSRSGHAGTFHASGAHARSAPRIVTSARSHSSLGQSPMPNRNGDGNRIAPAHSALRKSGVDASRSNHAKRTRRTTPRSISAVAAGAAAAAPTSAPSAFAARSRFDDTRVGR